MDEVHRLRRAMPDYRKWAVFEIADGLQAVVPIGVDEPAHLLHEPCWCKIRAHVFEPRTVVHQSARERN